jgi:predicted dehydrogenase
VAVAGQGSIGRRHAATLIELGCRLIAFDPASPDALPGAESAPTFEEAAERAGMAVIASPTSEHEAQALAAIERGCHVLVEKPLATSLAAGQRIADAARERNALLAVAMNMRFHPGPAKVKAAVDAGRIGTPLLAEFTFGSYLPDWRPSVDYRDSYSAQRALGGGILLDAIHEIDYASWILGAATGVSAWVGRVSQLEIDVEDAALLTLEFPSGAVASIHIDYLDRRYRRGCRIIGSEGTVAWSWQDEEVVLYRPGADPELEGSPSDVAPTYTLELERFMSAASGDTLSLAGTGLTPGSEGCAALAVIETARESAEHGGARRNVADPA